MPLVAFGHMHEKLRGTSSLRNMVEVDAATGTIYLNTAVVPRVRSKTIKGCEVHVTWVHVIWRPLLTALVRHWPWDTCSTISRQYSLP